MQAQTMQNGSRLLQEIADYIAGKAQDVLLSAPHIAETDAQLLRDNLSASTRDVADLQNILVNVGAVGSEAVFEIVAKLMIGSFIAGASGTLSTEADAWRNELSTYVMRHKKAAGDSKRMQENADRVRATKAFQGNPTVSADAIFAELGGSMSLATVKRRLADIRRGSHSKAEP